MHKPIDVGTLRPLAEDRVDDIAVDMAFVIGHRKKHQVVGFLGDGFIVHQILQWSDVIFDLHELDVALTKHSCLVENPHGKEKYRGNHNGKPATMFEFKKIGNEE